MTESIAKKRSNNRQKHNRLYISQLVNGAESRSVSPRCTTGKGSFLYGEQGFPRRESGSHTEKLTIT